VKYTVKVDVELFDSQEFDRIKEDMREWSSRATIKESSNH